MEAWEVDAVAPREHEPVAFLATAKLGTLVLFGAAMGKPSINI